MFSRRSKSTPQRDTYLQKTLEEKQRLAEEVERLNASVERLRVGQDRVKVLAVLVPDIQQFIDDVVYHGIYEDKPHDLLIEATQNIQTRLDLFVKRIK